MCLNQLLKNEQITLMRLAVATDLGEIGLRRRKLALFAKLLSAHPYPHRPYGFDEPAGNPLTPNTEASSPMVSAWENEGRAAEMVKSHKRSNRVIRTPNAVTPDGLTNLTDTSSNELIANMKGNL